jgi:3-hydroxyisobutyrate dehydrogenase-like beta-hydroxyacid dehydrogenase
VQWVREWLCLFELVEKDLSYAVETAHANGGKLPLTVATQQTYTKAIKQGYGADNITGVAQLYV